MSEIIEPTTTTTHNVDTRDPTGSKKVRFQGWLKMAQFLLTEIFRVVNFGFNYLRHFFNNFSTFFLIIWFKSTKMKFRPYYTMELVQNLMKKTSKYLIYSPLTEKVLTE